MKQSERVQPSERMDDVADPEVLERARRRTFTPRWWNPLEPDLFGGHLVAQHLTDTRNVLAGVLRLNNPVDLAQPLDMYARTVGDENVVGLCRAPVDQASSQPELRLLIGVPTVAATLSRLLEELDH